MKVNTLFQNLTVFFLLFATDLLSAQVGINSTGAAPSADAMLDVKSANKGGIHSPIEYFIVDSFSNFGVNLL